MDESGSTPRVTVLICTLNEEESLRHVLPRMPNCVGEVLLVDGHSTDRTVAVARQLRPDIRVLFQTGKGKGQAIRQGVQEARGEIVVTIDADGETDPAEIPRFLAKLAERYDVAKGSRLASKMPERMPRYRRLGNWVLAITFNLLYGTRYTDICSGFNAFHRSAFLRVPLTLDGFAMEQQFLARATKLGLRVIEVPHESDGRIAGASKTSGVKQGFTDWFVIIKERFVRMRQASGTR